MPQTLGQMYLTCGWLEAIFYGFNCMLFGFCVHVSTSSQTLSHKILSAAILQFSLSTAHVITTLIVLLQAFTNGVDSNKFYSSPGKSKPFLVGFYIYIANTFVQELLLIWRLYILWGRKFRFCIFPLFLWTCHVCIGILAVSSFTPKSSTSNDLLSLGLTAWGLETVTNLTANFGISYRLWKAERTMAQLTAQKRVNYQKTMLLIVECGTLITTCTLIMFGLYAAGHESGIVGVGIATQIATISPLLIVVRVGLDSQTRSRQSVRMMSAHHLPVEITVHRTEDTTCDNDYTSHATGKSLDEPGSL